MMNPRTMFDRFVERRTAHVPRVALSEPEKLRLVAAYGDFSLAYSTAVQDDLAHFGDKDGYIAFGSKMGSVFVLGDPVAARNSRVDLIERFVAAAPNACFVQIGRDTARVLAGLGFQVNRMGVDSRLALGDGHFAGKRNETVRYSERWLLKNGYAIVEDGGGAVMTAHVERLSQLWRAERIVKRREMRFLNRPFASVLGEGMRRFLLIDPSGTPSAVLDFDPISESGEVVGYTTSFKRKLPGVTPHAEIGMTKFAADRFREEGRRFMTLGLSPVAAIEESGFGESALLRGVLRRLFSSRLINRHVFNLAGQAAFKRRFHGEEEPVYLAFRKLSLAQMIGILRLCKAL